MNTRRDTENIRKEIDLYLDNRLNQQDHEQMAQKLTQDPNLRQEFDKEQHFRNFIKQKVKRPTMPPDFLQKIKNKLKR